MANASTFNLNNFYNILKSEKSILYAYQFTAEFLGADFAQFGISDSSDAAKNISYYIQSANIPERNLSNAKVPYLGTEFRVPGVLQYPQNWTCQVLITQDLQIYKGFKRWMDFISDLKLDGGGDKSIPDISIRLNLLDPTSQVCTTSFVLEGVWIKKLGEIALRYEQGGGSPVATFSCDLKYQYSYRDDNFDRSADPLKA